MMPWTVVRYDEDGRPSHPDEDLPPDGALVEMWRPGGDIWFAGAGACRRHLDADGHQVATIDNASIINPLPLPDDIPLDVTPGGVVWRPM